MKTGLALASLVCALSACEGAREPQLTSESLAAGREGGEARERRFMTVAWDTVFRAGGAVNDSLLLRPRLLDAGRRLVVVYDYYDARLKAFDHRGKLVWTFGARGSGPGEFRNPIDVAVDARERVWVLDGGIGRITIVSADGEMERLMSLPFATLRDILPLPDALIGTVVGADHFFVTLDSLGGVRERGPFPLQEFSTIDAALRQTIATTSPSQSSWSALLPFDRHLVVYEGQRVRCTGTLIEGLPARADDERPAVWAVAIAMNDTSVYVLARGRTADSLRVIDAYSAQDCRYLHSLRLPRRVRELTLENGVYFVLHEDPAPTLLALRPIVAGRPAP